MKRYYETVLVIDSLIEKDDVSGALDKIEHFATEHGGEVLDVDRWGKRKLAYEIAGKQYAYYIEVTFSLETEALKEFNRMLKMDESVLRYLTLRIDEKRTSKDLTKKRTAEEKPAEAAE